MGWESCGPWPLDSTCLPDGWSTDPAAWTDGQRAAVEIASELMWRWTYGRYGLCDETVRPCLPPCPTPVSPDSYGAPDRGALTVACGCGGTDCACTFVCEVALPGPVGHVEQVRVDGEVLPGPGETNQAWRIDNDQWLVRVDGGCWPRCQDMTTDDTEPGTFAVRYQRGRPVPTAGRRAVTAYAVEIAKACAGSKGCRLPWNVTQVDRNGVRQEFDVSRAAGIGRSGLPEVDTWVRAVNPHGLTSPAAVYSPDVPRYRTTSTRDPLGLTWTPD